MIRIAAASVAFTLLLGPTSVNAQALGARGPIVAGVLSSGGGGGSFAQPLRTGDLVRLTFWLDRELSGDYTIDETGEAVLPLVGRLVTSGLDPIRLKREIRNQYDQVLKDQDVQVVFLRRVRVLGQVRRPGLYHAEMGMDLGDLLALAEGVTEVGDMGNLRLVRRGRVVEEGLSPGLIVGAELQSGDQIYVPKESWLKRNSTAVLGTVASITVAIMYRGLSN